MSNRLLGTIKSGDYDTDLIKAIKALGDSSSDISAIEFEIMFDTTYDDYTESYTYDVGGNLDKKYYYQKGTVIEVWRAEYTFVAGILTQKDIISTDLGKALRITYSYNVGGDLIEKTRDWL